MNEESVTLRGRKVDWLPFLVFSLVFALICARAKTDGSPIALPGEIFFTLCSSLAVIAIWCADKCYLRLDNHGFHLHGVWGQGTCFNWTDVTDFKPVQVGLFGVVFVKKTAHHSWWRASGIPASYGLTSHAMAKMLEAWRVRACEH